MAAESNLATQPTQGNPVEHDLIEDIPDEADDTSWQDFLTYCAEVQS